jgi:hypothetical protein
MQAYGIRVPNPSQLADFLNRLEALGLSIFELSSLSGQFIVVVHTSAPLTGPFVLLEDGSYLLQESGDKLLLE